MRLSGGASTANDALGFLREATSTRSGGRDAFTRHTSKAHQGEDLDGVSQGTNARRVQRLEVENVDTLNGTEDLKTLETSSLVLVGGDFTGLRALTEDLWGGRVVGAARHGSRESTHSSCAGGPKGSASSERGGAEGGGEHGFGRLQATLSGSVSDDTCVTYRVSHEVTEGTRCGPGA